MLCGEQGHCCRVFATASPVTARIVTISVVAAAAACWLVPEHCTRPTPAEPSSPSQGEKRGGGHQGHPVTAEGRPSCRLSSSQHSVWLSICSSWVGSGSRPRPLPDGAGVPIGILVFHRKDKSFRDRLSIWPMECSGQSCKGLTDFSVPRRQRKSCPQCRAKGQMGDGEGWARQHPLVELVLGSAPPGGEWATSMGLPKATASRERSEGG